MIPFLHQQAISGSYDPAAPNQLIALADIVGDWQDIYPFAGPALILHRATRLMNRTPAMLRKLSEKVEQDKVLLAYQAKQMEKHKLVLEVHQNDPHVLEFGIIARWRARIIAHLDSQIEAVRWAEAALLTTQSAIAGISPQTMGPFQSSSGVLCLSYGAYAAPEPCE